MQQVQIEVAHSLTKDQLEGIYKSVYNITIQAIEDARKDSGINNDLIYTKVDLRKFIDNCSESYLEEILADETFPRGRVLSERKTVFSKKAVTAWLLENK